MPSPSFLPAICLALLITPAMAAEEGSAGGAPAAPGYEIGTATDALLNLQRSGLVAGELQAVQGEVAHRNYQRYLEGFEASSSVGRLDAQSAKPAASTSR